MTVENVIKSVVGNGNGSATSFSFSPMVISEADELEATKVDALGNETLLTRGTGSSDFTVVVSAYPGTGSITYPSTGSLRLASGEFIVMRRVPSMLQGLDLENQGGYFPELQEAAFDHAAYVDLYLQEQIDRSVRLPLGATDASAELPYPVADRLIGWDDTGTSLTNYAQAGTLPDPVTIAKGGTGSTTAALARTALGVDKTLVQTVTLETGAVATGTTIMPFDDTVPTNTEGDQYMSLSITPQDAANKLEIDVTFCGSLAIVPGAIQIALFKNSDAAAIKAVTTHYGATQHGVVVRFVCTVTAGGTSAITFKVRAGGSGAGTLTFNGGAGARLLGGVMASGMIIREYRP